MELGELRRSQVITTFGPGAIVDLRTGSFTMGGIDVWRTDDRDVIHEPNLERALGVDEFRQPPVSEDGHRGLPVIRFPTWLVCRKCHRLANLSTFLSAVGNRGPLRCPDQQCRGAVFPARLVVACVRGHIDDFPWAWWAHGNETGTCSRPALYINASGRTAALSAVYVSCHTCGRGRSLGGVFAPDALRGFHCNGARPWLQDREPGCEEQVRTLQRGASNVYFSVTVSGLSIPPWSSSLHALLDRYWRVLKSMPANALRDTIIDMHLPEQLNLDPDLVVRGILERRDAADADSDGVSLAQLRAREYDALRFGHPTQDERHDFAVDDEAVSGDLAGNIQTVRRVERLREVQVLRGFTRIDPPGTDNRLNIRVAPISANPGRHDWLPGVELRGEGIFIELDLKAVAEWEQERAVRQRARQLDERYTHMCDTRGWEKDRVITARFLLVHTLAHLLIRQFSLVCGYSSAALRERLYVIDADEDGLGRAAFLVYTATPDSEGSLGGLVRQARPRNLARLLFGALEEASWCSSDPLCIESQGQGYEALNLAACHSCALLPETCCEEFNRMLDRAMIVGTPDQPIGFFSALIDRYRQTRPDSVGA